MMKKALMFLLMLCLIVSSVPYVRAAEYDDGLQIYIYADKIVVRFSSIQLKAGQTFMPETVMLSRSELTFESSNSAVASVDQNGVVSAHRNGSAEITVSCGDAIGSFSVLVLPEHISDCVGAFDTDYEAYEVIASSASDVSFSQFADRGEGRFVFFAPAEGAYEISCESTVWFSAAYDGGVQLPHSFRNDGALCVRVYLSDGEALYIQTDAVKSGGWFKAIRRADSRAQVDAFNAAAAASHPSESASQNGSTVPALTETPVSTFIAAPTHTPAPQYTALEKGDRGEDVRRMQARLIELGYLSGKADGDFGRGTETAVKLFQKAIGMAQTGVMLPSQQELLYSDNAPDASSVATEKPTNKPTNKPAATTATPAATPKPAATTAKPAATPKPAATTAKPTATPTPTQKPTCRPTEPQPQQTTVTGNPEDGEHIIEPTATSSCPTPPPARETAEPVETPLPWPPMVTPTPEPTATPKPTATPTPKPTATPTPKPTATSSCPTPPPARETAEPLPTSIPWPPARSTPEPTATPTPKPTPTPTPKPTQVPTCRPTEPLPGQTAEIDNPEDDELII